MTTSLGIDTRSAVRLTAAGVWIGVILVAHAGLAAPVRGGGAVTELMASVVHTLLPWTGIDALRAGPLLYVPGVFAYEVALGCTGVSPAAVLAVAIVTTPAAGAARWWGLLVGVLCVLAVNVVRLVHLFHAGVEHPGRFEQAHGFLWEAIIVGCTFATWFCWSRWAARSRLAAAAGGQDRR